MFSTQTLFILGAGASAPYGFPLGKELINCILEDMGDQILIPRYRGKDGSPPHWNDNDRNSSYLYEFEYLHDKLIEIKDKLALVNLEKIFFENNSLNISDCYHSNDSANSYQIVTINEIDIFRKLFSALKDFSPISIDAFLRDNPSHKEAGKTMIIYSLLKRENQKKFNLSNDDKENDDNWYALLLNDLVSECADHPQKLLENKIEFLTFNYDMSLDYYLESKMKKIELFSSLTEDFLNKTTLEHIYGKVYNDNLEFYGTFSDIVDTDTESQPFESDASLVSQLYLSNKFKKKLPKKIFQNFKRFVFGINNFTNIKTMYDERNHKELEDVIKINKAKILKADEIIFIGFSFDRDNLNMLGIPSCLKKFNQIFPGKTVRFLNYKGKMKSLSLEFERLEKECKKGKLLTKIISSSADSISDAYINDFKKYLFL